MRPEFLHPHHPRTLHGVPVLPGQPRAPKYFTWHKRASGWTIRAYWPDSEPLPEPGDQVTVHRKNRTTSVVTIREVEGPTYLPSGQAGLDCFVE